MCQKLNDDRSNNYTACNEHDVIDRPVVLADTCLVALICRDCNPEKPHDIRRHQELKDSIVRGKKTHNIVCIPAHMSGGSGFGAEGIASSWPTSDVITVARAVAAKTRRTLRFSTRSCRARS